MTEINKQINSKMQIVERKSCSVRTIAKISKKKNDCCGLENTEVTLRKIGKKFFLQMNPNLRYLETSGAFMLDVERMRNLYKFLP